MSQEERGERVRVVQALPAGMVDSRASVADARPGSTTAPTCGRPLSARWPPSWPGPPERRCTARAWSWTRKGAGRRSRTRRRCRRAARSAHDPRLPAPLPGPAARPPVRVGLAAWRLPESGAGAVRLAAAVGPTVSSWTSAGRAGARGSTLRRLSPRCARPARSTASTCWPWPGTPSTTSG
ncbi:hypothetical protein NKH77_38850 [Streptomyces sp. M19]